MSKLSDWEKTSLDSVPDTHPVLPLIAALLLGVAVLAGTSSAPAAVCSAGLGVSISISRSTRSAKQYDSIRNYGCYSISLDETLLAEYIRFNGLEHTKAEIIWAQEQDILVSEACENLIDGTTEAMPQRLPPQIQGAVISPALGSIAPIMPQSVSSEPAPITQPNITEYVPQSKQSWCIADMLPEIDNRLILGLKGSGKSVLVGKMLEIVRTKFPTKRIFVIDPKSDKREQDIYRFADEVHSGNIGEMTPDEGLKFIKDGFEKYMKHPEPGLLILDEAIMIGGCMSDNKSNYLESKLRYVVAGGDSRGLNVWLISQSPMLADLGLKTGVSSQLNLTIIATKHSLPNIKAWSGGSLMTGVVADDALPAIEACLIPKGRAILSGGFWHPMPIIETAWNRDDRVMNPAVSTPPLSPLEDAKTDTVATYGNTPATTPQTASSDSGVDTETAVAGDVLAFFNAVNTATPRTIRDIRMGRRIRKSGATAEAVQVAIDTLVLSGKLSLSNGGYVLPKWNAEDLN